MRGGRLAELVSPELRPYVTYSFALHLALALVGAKVLGLAGAKGKSTVYTIDFVGGPTRMVTSIGDPAAAAAATPAQPTRPSAPAAPTKSGEFDEFGRRKGRKNFILPRPSLLKGAQAPSDSRGAAGEPPATGSGVSAADSTAPGSGGDAGVSADLPNFPYPWYISQVRQMLWSQWRARMPAQAGETVVVFSLMPNGSVVDLRTETSSGDSSFDLTALAAVQDASPYPPLPAGFAEPFLKIHVTLRSQ